MYRRPLKKKKSASLCYIYCCCYSSKLVPAVVYSLEFIFENKKYIYIYSSVVCTAIQQYLQQYTAVVHNLNVHIICVCSIYYNYVNYSSSRLVYTSCTAAVLHVVGQIERPSANMY